MYSTLWKNSVDIVYIFKVARSFSTKLWHSDQRYNSNIFTPPWLKFETSAHAQLVITHRYMPSAYLLTCYQLETYIEDNPWYWVYRWAHDFFRKYFLVCNSILDLSTRGQAIKFKLGRNTFTKRSVWNFQSKISFLEKITWTGWPPSFVK